MKIIVSDSSPLIILCKCNSLNLLKNLFCNSQGEIILLGVDDNNIVTGLNIDNSTRSKLETTISAINPKLV